MEEAIRRAVGQLTQGQVEQQTRMTLEKVRAWWESMPIDLRRAIGGLTSGGQLPPGTVYPTNAPVDGWVLQYDSGTGTAVWVDPETLPGVSTSPWQVAFTNGGDVALRNDGTIATVSTP